MSPFFVIERVSDGNAERTQATRMILSVRPFYPLRHIGKSKYCKARHPRREACRRQEGWNSYYGLSPAVQFVVLDEGI